MIVTVTLNPSVDYVMKLSDLEVGGLNRSSDVQYYPGGKGINVSQVLKELGVATMATGFIGGFSGSFIKDSLEEKTIDTNFIFVEEPTRINVKLKTGEETDINGAGPVISDDKLQALISILDQYGEGDTLVLAGSIPASVPADVYGMLTEKAVSRGMKVVIDAERTQLEPTLKFPLHLIKPNHHELGGFFDVQIETVEDAVAYGKKLLEYDIEHILVSMAGEGAVLITENRILHADVPKGQLVNSVGAGDSTVAGFLAAEAKGLPLEDVFKYSIASGSATAFSEGLADRETIEHLLPQVTVKELK